MMKFHDVKVGDYLIADNDGDKKRGEVTDLNGDEKQVCVNTGSQDFWYEMDQISPITLDEEQLMDLKFVKEVQEDGSVKYSKGAFRLSLFAKDDFSKMEIWYRDERRHIMQPICVHQLQNHFHDMTKVLLNHESFN